MATMNEMFNKPTAVCAGGKRGNGGPGRHRALWEYGMRLRGIGLPAKDIIRDMKQFNEESCIPPISKYDLDRMTLAVIQWEFN